MLWQGKRVLVTGATGFIGGGLVRHLIDQGATVYAGVWPGEIAERVASLPAQAERLWIELQDMDSVQRAVEVSAPEVVFHLAAVGVSERGIKAVPALNVNTVGTVYLLEALHSFVERSSVTGCALQRVVLAGTCYEYGARQTIEGLDPLDFYAASKAAAWAFARAYWRIYHLPVVTARLFQVYGPGQPSNALVPAAIIAALTGQDFPMTVGEQRRDFIYLEDVIDGLTALAFAPAVEGQSFDLGSGVDVPVRQVVDLIWKLTGATGRVLAGALPYRRNEVPCLVADAERTATLVGWRSRTDLENGLRRTIDGFSRELPR